MKILLIVALAILATGCLNPQGYSARSRSVYYGSDVNVDDYNGQVVTVYGNGQYGYMQSYAPVQLPTYLPSQMPHYTHDENHFFYDGEWY